MKNMTFILLFLLNLFIISCFTRIDNSESKPPLDPVTYSGKTSQAVITSDNANIIFSYVWEGGSTTHTEYKKSNVESSSPLKVRSKLLKNIKTNLIRRSNSRSVAKSQNVNEIEYGTASGTLRITGTINNDGTGTLYLVYSNYNDGDGITVDGEYEVVVHSYNFPFDIIINADYNFLKISFTDSFSSVSFSGTLNSVVEVSSNTGIDTWNIDGLNNSTGKYFRYQNLIIESVYNDLMNPSSYTESYTGKVFIEDYGYVDVSCILPLVYSNNIQLYPDSGGPLILNGSDNSNIEIIPLTDTRVRIEVDEDGDNLNESYGVYLWDDLTGAALPNTPPVANAGVDQEVNNGNIVTLDGNSSYDPDGDIISYQWSLLSIPDGSIVSLSNSTSSVAGFTPDVSGLYVIGLTVNDGYGNSLEDSVEVFSLFPGLIFVDDDQICNNMKPCFNNIQDAVNAASTGYTVKVYPGIYYENIEIRKKSITLESVSGADNTIIDGNNIGSVIYVYDETSSQEIIINGFTIKNSGQILGLYLNFGWSGSTAVIKNNIITQNSGEGGIKLRYVSDIGVDIINNLIFDNSIGIIIKESTTDHACSGYVNVVNNEIFLNINSSPYPSDYGGGIVIDGPYWPESLINTNIINNTLYANEAIRAGGIGANGYYITIKNNIIFQNIARDYNEDDIFLLQYGLTAIVMNNIIGDGQFNGVNNNISGDPLFIDSVNYNFNLQQFSPAIDSGLNNDAPDIDFYGNMRPFDGDQDGTATVDIGAVEYTQ